MSWNLAVQEQLVGGRSLEKKYEAALAAGFAGIELRGNGDGTFRARLPELTRARAAGVVMPTVCVMMDHFIGDFDPDRRRSARAGMKELLDVIVQAGGFGAITPAAFGQFSSALPPFVSPRSKAADRAVLLEELHALGEYAASIGAIVLLEPLNRYEDHMINTLAQGVDLIKEIGLASVRLMADTFHMNIEETDPAAHLQAALPWLGHIQAADSSRLEPGTGHIDWSGLTAVLDHGQYEGWIALECGLSGASADVLAKASTVLRPPSAAA